MWTICQSFWCFTKFHWSFHCVDNVFNINIHIMPVEFVCISNLTISIFWYWQILLRAKKLLIIKSSRYPQFWRTIITNNTLMVLQILCCISRLYCHNQAEIASNLNIVRDSAERLFLCSYRKEQNKRNTLLIHIIYLLFKINIRLKKSTCIKKNLHHYLCYHYKW